MSIGVLFADCAKGKRGFKNVFAKKSWHGMYGFDYLEGCEICPTPTCCYQPSRAVANTKYRRVKVDLHSFHVDPNDPCNKSARYHHLREYEVLASSGIVLEQQAVDSVTGDYTGLGPQDTRLMQSAIGAINFKCGPPSLVTLFRESAAAGGNITIAEERSTERYYFKLEEFQKICSQDNYSVTSYECEIIFSQPYTSDDINGELRALKGTWNLSDDVTYPWRADASVTAGPLVTYNEFDPTEPWVGFQPVGYIDPRQLPHPELVGGAILGAPGAMNYYDAAHINWNYDATNNPGVPPTVGSVGATSPYPHATQWVDNRDAAIFMQGGFLAFNSLLTPWSGLVVYPEVLLGAKYVETILVGEKPSHNWARPCGDDRKSVNNDLTTLDCSGNLRWPDAPDCSGVWNDSSPKGDFVMLEWRYNYRDVGYNAYLIGLDRVDKDYSCAPDLPAQLRPHTGGLAQIICTQYRVACAPCGEIAGAVTGNGETFEAGATIVIPTLQLDSRYGALWQAIPKQWMIDPLSRLWLKCRDTGPINYEEARCSVPVGAPALPAGAFVGCLSVEQLNQTPVPVGGDCGAPLEGVPWFMAWHGAPYV